MLPSLEPKGIQAGIDTDQANLEGRIRRGLAVAFNQPHSGMFKTAVAHVQRGAADWTRMPREQAESPWRVDRRKVASSRASKFGGLPMKLGERIPELLKRR